MYCPPALSSAGQGLYALIGHHPKPGKAPIPPPIRPSPLQPRGAAERATPQREQVLDESEVEGGEGEVEGPCYLFFVVLKVAVASQRERGQGRRNGKTRRRRGSGLDDEDSSFFSSRKKKKHRARLALPGKLRSKFQCARTELNVRHVLRTRDFCEGASRERKRKRRIPLTAPLSLPPVDLAANERRRRSGLLCCRCCFCCGLAVIGRAAAREEASVVLCIIATSMLLVLSKRGRERDGEGGVRKRGKRKSFCLSKKQERKLSAPLFISDFSSPSKLSRSSKKKQQRQPCPQSRCGSFSFFLAGERVPRALSPRRWRCRRDQRRRTPVRGSRRLRRRKKKTAASSSSSFVAISICSLAPSLQTGRGRPPSRPEGPPRSLFTPAKARLDALYLNSEALDSSERASQGGGSKGVRTGARSTKKKMVDRDDDDDESIAHVFRPFYTASFRAFVLFFPLVGRKSLSSGLWKCCISISRRHTLSRKLSHSFDFASCFSFFPRRRERKKLSLSLFSTSALSLFFSLSRTFPSKMENKKTKQPPRFLLFGGTGWIGGLVSEILTKEGATWMASKARLEDRALILKEFEEVR